MNEEFRPNCPWYRGRIANMCKCAAPFSIMEKIVDSYSCKFYTEERRNITIEKIREALARDGYIIRSHKSFNCKRIQEIISITPDTIYDVEVR